MIFRHTCGSVQPLSGRGQAANFHGALLTGAGNTVYPLNVLQGTFSPVTTL